MKANLLSFVLLTAILHFISCEGPEGPAGPKGDSGETGDTGPEGPVGTANVIYSDWISYDLKSGIYAFVYFAEINVPKLSQDILDKGDIRIYITNGYEIWALPHATMPDFYYTCQLEKIRLFSVTDWDSYSGYKVRYVLIPGGVNARTSSPTLDYNDYYAVCQFYGIPE